MLSVKFYNKAYKYISIMPLFLSDIQILFDIQTFLLITILIFQLNQSLRVSRMHSLIPTCSHIRVYDSVQALIVQENVPLYHKAESFPLCLPKHTKGHYRIIIVNLKEKLLKIYYDEKNHNKVIMCFPVIRSSERKISFTC